MDELDEMWTFVGRKQRRVWLWLAVERVSRPIVASVLGTRGTATCQRLWVALPARYRRHCGYHTDEWPAYAAVLPVCAHRRDEPGQPNMVEALNCSLRHRCGVLVRKSCSFSKSLTTRHARIKIVIDHHNASITLL